MKMAFLTKSLTDQRLLDAANDDSKQVVKAAVSSSVFNAFITAGGAFLAGSQFLHLASPKAIALLAVSSAALVPFVMTINGSVIRSVATDAKVKASTLIPRLLLLPIATAVIVGGHLVLKVYGQDIKANDKKAWQQTNATELKKAESSFDKQLQPQRDKIAALKAAIVQVDTQTEAFLPKKDNDGKKTLVALRAQNQTLTARLMKLKISRTELEAKIECESKGFKCRGGSGKPGIGYKTKTLRFAELKPLNKQIAILESEQTRLAAQIAKLEAPSPTKTVPSKFADRRKALLDQLSTAQDRLVEMQSGLKEFREKQVPYSSPGLADSIANFAQVSTADPLNTIFAVAWLILILGLDLAFLPSAFALRNTDYARAIRGKHLEDENLHSSARVHLEIRAIKDEIELVRARKELDFVKLEAKQFLTNAANSNSPYSFWKGPTHG